MFWKWKVHLLLSAINCKGPNGSFTPGQEPGNNGFLYYTVHTKQRQEQKQGTIVFCCVHPSRCPCPVPGSVQCVWALMVHSDFKAPSPGTGLGTGLGKGLNQWVLIYYVEMFTPVRDRERGQDPLFPIMPIPFPVPPSARSRSVWISHNIGIISVTLSTIQHKKESLNV